MSPRFNSPFVILVIGLAAFAASFALPTLTGTSLSLATDIEFLVVLVVAAVAGFRALRLRNALFVRVYRDQALGVAIAALATGFTGLINLGNQGSAPTTGNALVDFLFGGPLFVGLVFLGLFYMVDSTSRAARLSDPLLRDTLHWRRIRKVLWGLDVLFVLLTYPTGFFFIIFTFLFPLVAGALMFPVLARRTGDPTLKRNLGWLGVFFVFFFLSAFSFYGNLVVSGVFLIVAGTSLFGSVRSLAPVNKIEPLKPAAV
jgi:hypothetical protein